MKSPYQKVYTKGICASLITVSATVVTLASCTKSTTSQTAGALKTEPQRLEVGRFKSRGILTCAQGAHANAPIAILMGGSGITGAEGVVPPEMTLDKKPAALISSFAEGVRAAGIHTLQLGKPGVEFFTEIKIEKIFYNKDMFWNATWSDLVANIRDAVSYATENQPCGATSVILVGHSEGTSVITDAAAEDARVRGVVYLGFEGRSIKNTIDWQMYKRPIEVFVSTDVDTDHDGFVTRQEAAAWPQDFTYVWKDGETKISYAEYEAYSRANSQYKDMLDSMQKYAVYSNGIWDREHLHAKVATLKIPVLGFTGSIDVQTPPSELLEVKEACAKVGKTNCETHIVPGLGHGFSPARPPRAQVMLDSTMGPVVPEFLETLSSALKKWDPVVNAK